MFHNSFNTNLGCLKVRKKGKGKSLLIWRNGKKFTNSNLTFPLFSLKEGGGGGDGGGKGACPRSL